MGYDLIQFRYLEDYGYFKNIKVEECEWYFVTGTRFRKSRDLEECYVILLCRIINSIGKILLKYEGC